MAHVAASYSVVTTDPIELLVGGDTDRTLEFTVPKDAVLAGSPMIVTFLLLLSVNNLHMTISIDGNIVSDREYTDGAERCIQELATDVSVDQSSKTMTFTVLRGSAVFTDVLLWFRRDTTDDEGLVNPISPF